MTDLLAKLQNATEGSRELDEDVALFLGHPATVTYGDGVITEERTVPRNPRHYTTNLQDAVSLVPAGWHIDHLSSGDSDTRPSNPAHYCRSIVRPNLNNDHGWGLGTAECDGAPTMALALCIAIIKAHEATPGFQVETVTTSAEGRPDVRIGVEDG